MPRLHPEAPDLAVSPDGAWAAELGNGILRLYGLSEPSDGAESRLDPVAEVERVAHPGRVVFLRPDRLLHLYIAPPDGDGDEGGSILAEMLTVPTLASSGRSVRAQGAQRILGAGAGGAVVAPQGPGADIIAPRGNDLIVHRTFTRSEVLSAVPTPDQRFLLEQRTGFELWDPQTRRALARLVLGTRQPPAQLGFIQGGRMLWSLTTMQPLHLELFRASDGRRLFEMEQAGRAREAESGTNRLVVAYEEAGVLGFLDLDLGARELRRIAMPAEVGAALGFAVVPGSAPAILVRLDEDTAPLLRLPLVPIAQGRDERTAPARPRPDRPERSPGPAPIERAPSGSSPRPLSRLLRSEPPPAPPPPPASPTRALRDARPESQLIRRAPPTGSTPPEELRAPPRRTVRPPTELRPSTPVALADDDLDALDGGAEPPLFAFGAGASAGGLAGDDETRPRQELGEPAPLGRTVEPVGRGLDPRGTPAVWLWELSRWTQQSLAGEVSPPPEGGPLQQLGARLRLSVPAMRALGLLLGVRSLLGREPDGLSPVEVAEFLGGLHDEPSVLAELLPGAPLRALGLVRRRSRREPGRLVIAADVAAVLLGAPCRDAAPGLRRETLPIGLHLWPRPCPRNPAHLCGQSFVRVDGLRVGAPLGALRSALRRALLHDIAVVVDGLPGLSFTSPHADAALLELRLLLQAPTVPVVLCAPPEAAAALGLLARQLPEALAAGSADPGAPLLPSAPLPSGTAWRPPVNPVPPVSLEGGRRGLLEPTPTADRRAGVLVEESAEPAAVARAAYLAARDGAVLVLPTGWLLAHAALVAQWLRQLPVLITATPPIAGSPTEWPKPLAPFVRAT
ncbi:MAG: hypothetical protein U1A78_07510 [Polyangia bacterium]